MGEQIGLARCGLVDLVPMGWSVHRVAKWREVIWLERFAAAFEDFESHASCFEIWVANLVVN